MIQIPSKTAEMTRTLKVDQHSVLNGLNHEDSAIK